MSIPNDFNPLGSTSVIMIDDYLNAAVDESSVNIPTSLTLADSLGFDLCCECIYRGGFKGWWNIMFLGGKAGTGWFGLQRKYDMGNEKQFIFSNNSFQNQTILVAVEIDTPLVCRINKEGLYVNDVLYQSKATQAYNKTTRVSLNWCKLVSMKSIVLTSNGVKVVDVHAALVNGKKCLYDMISKIRIPVE